mmetsp:Transcript_11055/g.27152  ORF Transcript_11055/g.27152 Transcript_11055/m.27152 type:complete len:230 (-) Transcript_11055:491-1180(-)
MIGSFVVSEEVPIFVDPLTASTDPCDISTNVFPPPFASDTVSEDRISFPKPFLLESLCASDSIASTLSFWGSLLPGEASWSSTSFSSSSSFLIVDACCLEVSVCSSSASSIDSIFILFSELLCFILSVWESSRSILSKSVLLSSDSEETSQPSDSEPSSTFPEESPLKSSCFMYSFAWRCPCDSPCLRASITELETRNRPPPFTLNFRSRRVSTASPSAARRSILRSSS